MNILPTSWKSLAGSALMLGALAFPTPAQADYCFGEKVTTVSI